MTIWMIVLTLCSVASLVLSALSLARSSTSTASVRVQSEALDHLAGARQDISRTVGEIREQVRGGLPNEREREQLRDRMEDAREQIDQETQR